MSNDEQRLLAEKRESIRNDLSVQGQAGFIDEDPHEYRDFATVESQRNDLTAEEFPEGPYGSSLLVESLGKSTPWREDQRSQNRFSYENRKLHEGLPRAYPGGHFTHDERQEGHDQDE